MINLIPPEAKKHLKKNYRIRVISAWLLLWGAALLLVALFMTPAYLLVAMQFNALTDYLDAPSRDTTIRKDLEQQIAEANRLANKLIVTDSTPALHQVIQTLESIALPDINLTSFMITDLDKNHATITLHGVAPNQSQLNIFRREVTAHKFFNQAEFSKKHNNSDQVIEFTMQLILKSV